MDANTRNRLVAEFDAVRATTSARSTTRTLQQRRTSAHGLARALLVGPAVALLLVVACVAL